MRGCRDAAKMSRTPSVCVMSRCDGYARTNRLLPGASRDDPTGSDVGAEAFPQATYETRRIENTLCSDVLHAWRHSVATRRVRRLVAHDDRSVPRAGPSAVSSCLQLVLLLSPGDIRPARTPRSTRRCPRKSGMISVPGGRRCSAMLTPRARSSTGARSVTRLPPCSCSTTGSR